MTHIYSTRYYVYILKLSSSKHYVGFTTNLERRMEEHLSGQGGYTAQHLPVSLVNYFAFKTRNTAYEFEQYLKSGSGRAFMHKRLI